MLDRRQFVTAALALAAMPVATRAFAARPEGISDADWDIVSKFVDSSKVKWDVYDASLGLKKDGSPYRVVYTPSWMGDDIQVVAEGILRTQLEQAGVEFTTISSDLNPATQARVIEDAIATKNYDAIILQPYNPVVVNGSIEKAMAAGLHVYATVTPPNTDQYTCFAGYDATQMDTVGQVGQKFVELAEASGATAEKPFKVLELWGGRAYVTDQTRHEGFMKGIGGNPIVQVIETPDTQGNPETIVKVIEDAFAQHPEIQAFYPHWGDSSAFAEGLRSAGRLAPKEDPNHVFVVLQDVDKSMLPMLRDGTFDLTLSNTPWPYVDVLVKMVLWHTVLQQPTGQEGEQLPKNVTIPMPLLNGEQIDGEEGRIFAATAAFPQMPIGKWDAWPVLDTADAGYPIPTLADRQRLLGY